MLGQSDFGGGLRRFVPGIRGCFDFFGHFSVAHFIEETRGDGIAGLAPFFPRLGHGDGEVVAGAGDPDVHEAAFLGDGGFAGFERTVVGEDPFFEADEVDARELESLGAVEGHHADAALVELVFLGVGFVFASGEAGFLEVFGQSRVGAAGGVLVEGLGHLLDGLDAEHLLAGFLVLLVDFGFVVDFGDELAEDGAHLFGVSFELFAEAGEEVVELLECSGGGLGDIGFAGGMGGDVPEADFFLDGFGEDFFDGGVADASGGGIDDAEEGHFIGGLGEDLEVGHQVTGFAAIEEGGGADEDVGDFLASEFSFENARLFVGAEEDGDVVGGDLEFLNEVVNVADDLFGLLLIIGEGGEADGVGGDFVGDEFLVMASAIVADEGVGEVEDLVGAAVVVFQTNDLGAGENVLEVEDVFQLCSAPAVDGLVVVADDAEIFVGADEGFDEGELEAVGVLVLVDLDEVEAFLLSVENFGVFEEELVGEEEEVVEIDGPAGAEVGLVAAIAGGGDVFDVALGGVGGEGGGDALRFPGTDLVDEIAGLHGLFGDANVTEGGAGGGFLITAVVDDEGTGVAEVGDFGAEDADAE